MRRAGLAGLVVLGALARPAAPLAAQDTTAARTARITYLTSQSAYLDAGRLDGLREGARVDVVRGPARIGVLRVAYLASHRAACDIVSAAVPLVVGDSARFLPAAVPRDTGTVARAPAAAAGAVPAARPSGPALRGRVGAEYFLLDQRGVPGASVSEPALDLRLDGSPFGASWLNLVVDARARRSYTVLADGTTLADGHNRVYQAALSFQSPGSPARVTAGRQLAGSLGPVGLFDGLLAELRQPDWSVGVFTGAEPEPIDLGFSSSVVALGGYLERHSRPGAATHWAVTFGASGSYDAGHANREFAFLQASYLSRRLSTFVTQEVDYYRPWKLLPGMQAVSPTATFATIEYRLSDAVAVNGGFDNRRNVRLYRDVVTPETAFDDAYRQGAWAGLWLKPSPRFRVGLDARSSSGPSGPARSYTASLGGDRLGGLDTGLRTRVTYYTNPQLTGWLSSAALTLDPNMRLQIELNGGIRSEHDPMADPANTSVTWVGSDVDVTLARGWYLMLSATRQRGGLDGYDQVFAGASFRF